MKVRLLGTGTSSGVPRVGNDWGACDPADPRNRRRRVSILVSDDDTRILIDTSPDLREQLLDAAVGQIDGVIWTHDHADHCHGLDDLRQLFHARGSAIPGYARPETLATLRRRFSYAFAGENGYPTMIDGRPLGDRLRLGTLAVRVVDQPHGPITSAGLRFDVSGKALVYSTDVSAMTDEMAALFAGVDLLILDCLRRRPHPSHPHLDLALEWIERLAPKRALLTHLDQSMDYRELVDELPPHVAPGYDGLEIEL